MPEEKIIPQWYKRPVVDKEKRDEFYEKRCSLQYREIMTEVPAKMLLELGKIAKDKGIGFNNFIEDILEQYLESQGIKWRETPDKVGEWEKYI
ncbi:MAG: hypothetical protein GTN80_00525 [Nitrososphaeria archaeon]|nr:hypothetical protein [Nitrososphaeria archaeon]NIQ32130.1 hypothetical protein [Nitrososphaeria archaeon]